VNGLKIKFLGACGIVTGSSYFLSDQTGRGILIDLGMFQGSKKEEKLNFQPLQLDVAKVDAVLLTHAHLDHCGRLPLLYKKGYRGKIFMTAATRDLIELVLFDSAKIAEKERKHDALYTKDDVAGTLDLVETINYHKEFVAGNFAVKAYDSGHLLGSCSFHLNDGKTKIVFSGDLGNSPQTLVKPTELLPSADIVIMETTYGDREHPKEHALNLIQREINFTERDKGTLLIPSFSLNRTQDLLYKIKIFKKVGKIKKETPVFLDSPMAIKATNIHKNYRNLFSRKLFEEAKKGDPFGFPKLMTTMKGNKIIGKTPGPKVIIAGSGMMSGGRMIDHAKNYLPLKNTRLLIVGYQGAGTLGREIQEGNKVVKIDGKKIPVNANVFSLGSMSSHAGQHALVNWLTHIKGVKKLFLTHGDEPSRQNFMNLIRKKQIVQNIFTPRLNEEKSIT